MGGPALESPLDRSHVEQVLHLRPVACAVEDVARSGGGDAEESGRDAGARDLMYFGAVFRDEARRAVNADAGPGDCCPPWDGYVDAAGSRPQEPMECRGRLVREERSITTGKYGGRPSA